MWADHTSMASSAAPFDRLSRRGRKLRPFGAYLRRSQRGRDARESAPRIVERRRDLFVGEGTELGHRVLEGGPVFRKNRVGAIEDEADQRHRIPRKQSGLR